MAKAGKWAILFSFILLFLSFSSFSWARNTSASVNLFHPAVDPSAYLSIYGSQTMRPWSYQVGTYFNYAKNPLEVGLAGAARASIIPHLMMWDVFGSLGITDWFQIGLDVPVAVYDQFNDLATGRTSAFFRMSDVRLETKFRLLDIEQYKIGMAILPYLVIPTGSGAKLVGNNSWAGGGKFIVDFDILDRVQISTNLGFEAREAVTILNTPRHHSFTYGMGVNIKTVNWLDIIGEMYGSTNVDNFFKREAETPLELDAGLRFSLPKPEGLAITVGGGAGVTFGFGAPDFRLFLGVTYPNPKRAYSPEPPPPPVIPEKIAIPKAIHFEYQKAVIRPVSFPILDGVVEVIKSNRHIRKVRVEGHTDSKGSDDYNMRLSQRRADAVREYLIAHGIDEDRLVAVGYGETRPVDTNESAEGRARNRRVEFTILDQE